MSNVALPARPSLEQLKKQAKELLESFRFGQPEAVALVKAFHPAQPLERCALHDAQLVLARHHGFPSWTKLKEEVERRACDFSERAARFVRDSVGNNIARARRALASEPELATSSIWSRLVLGDLSSIKQAIQKDKEFPRKAGGPRESWTPLLYVCFSRFQMVDEETPARFADCAKVLLEAGADPNAFWKAQPWDSPLKPLYGACGENDNPAMARLLLQHGAELNDGESIYHAAEHYHLECMEVLREFGVSLGRHPLWKNTPVYFLLGYSPNHGNWPALKKGLQWLLEHGCDPKIRCGDHEDTALHVAVRGGHSLETIRMLLQAGADVGAADNNGLTPMILARRGGRGDVVALLREFGAEEVQLDEKELFFEFVFSGNEESALNLLRQNTAIPGQFTEDDLLSLNRAAERGNTEAVRILLKAGFDISYKGTQNWGCTPLHIAAWQGMADVVDLLLAEGARVDVRANPPEDSYPLDWATHGSAHCRNPRADYPRVVRALLAAGAQPRIGQAEMSSPEVADLIHMAMAGREE